MPGGLPFYSFFSFSSFQSQLCPPALAREALLGPGRRWKLNKLKKTIKRKVPRNPEL